MMQVNSVALPSGKPYRERLQQSAWGCALAWICMLAACVAEDTPYQRTDGVPSVDVQESELAVASLQRRQYFGVVADLRECPSPRCGGFFVHALNRRYTRCADGSVARRCYVASIDWSALGGDPGIYATTLVVAGVLEERAIEGVEELGVLVASDAWGSATDAPATGAFYRLADNGIRCITEPCFSIDAELLNGGSAGTLSGLDLTAVGASREQLERAYAALAHGDLLASGQVQRREVGTGIGRELVASQFFLGAEPSECATDADCPRGTWCRQREIGGYECVPFAQEGESCEGFTLPWWFERCAPELVCDTPPFIIDAPGVCRTRCASEADCTSEAYCASDGLCHDDGTCDFTVDCNLSGNSYPHQECVGHGVCPELGQQCGWECAEPRCLDLTGYDFGPCDAVLGWGVLSGACTTLSGCDAGPFTLFESEADCRSACQL